MDYTAVRRSFIPNTKQNISTGRHINDSPPAFFYLTAHFPYRNTQAFLNFGCLQIQQGELLPGILSQTNEQPFMFFLLQMWIFFHQDRHFIGRLTQDTSASRKTSAIWNSIIPALARSQQIAAGRAVSDLPKQYKTRRSNCSGFQTFGLCLIFVSADENTVGLMLSSSDTSAELMELCKAETVRHFQSS